MMGAECLNVEGLSSLEDARQKLVASPAVVAAPGELRNRQAQTCPGFASFLKGRASGTRIWTCRFDVVRDFLVAPSSRYPV
jgi:hypothetical protein